LILEKIIINREDSMLGQIKNRDLRLRKFIFLMIGFLSVYFVLVGIKNSASNRVKANGTNYFIDCNDGNDTYTGTSMVVATDNTGPWKTLDKVKNADITAGSTISLKRGCTWDEQLYINKNGTAVDPITIKDYGTGNLPMLSLKAGTVKNATVITDLVYINGEYITLKNIHLKGIEENVETAGVCAGARKGDLKGIDLSSSSYINLTNNTIEGFSTGIFINSASHHNKILNTNFINNSMMSVLTGTPSDDMGATAVSINGNSNQAAYNTISGSDACSVDYQKLGVAFEVSGTNNIVSYNKSIDNLGFVKIDKSTALENVFAYNLIRSNIDKASFININAGLQSRFYNNTVYLGAVMSKGVNCTNCGADVLTLKNNIIWAEGRVGDSNVAFNERDNIYWRLDGVPQYNFQKSASQEVSDNINRANPEFVNLAGFNFHISETSPAKDPVSGQTDAYNSNFFTDLDGKSVPLGSNRDIGAYEVMPTITPSPTPILTLTPTVTVSPTMIPSPSITPGVTLTITPTPMITSTPTATSTPMPTVIVTSTPAPVSIATPTPAPMSQVLGVISTPSPVKTSIPAIKKTTSSSTNTLAQISKPTTTPTSQPTTTPSTTTAPSPTDTAKLIFDFDSGKVFDTKKPAFSGKATPNMDIEVEISPSDKKVRVKSDTKGDWLVMMSDELAEGDYKASAFIIKADGTRGQEFGPIQFKIDVQDEVKKDKNLNNMIIGIGSAVLACVILGIILTNKRFLRKK
jgi:hypothetical protein